MTPPRYGWYRWISMRVSGTPKVILLSKPEYFFGEIPNAMVDSCTTIQPIWKRRRTRGGRLGESETHIFTLMHFFLRFKCILLLDSKSLMNCNAYCATKSHTRIFLNHFSKNANLNLAWKLALILIKNLNLVLKSRIWVSYVFSPA